MLFKRLPAAEGRLRPDGTARRPGIFRKSVIPRLIPVRVPERASSALDGLCIEAAYASQASCINSPRSFHARPL